MTIDLPSRTAALLWIIDNQKGRGNVSDIDRIALQQRRAEVVATEAKKHQSVGGKAGGKLAGRGRPKKIGVWQNCQNPLPIDTRKESAKAAGVGERTDDAGKLILDAAARHGQQSAGALWIAARCSPFSRYGLENSCNGTSYSNYKMR